MNEVIKTWLTMLYEKEINDTKEDIKNERMWELGYSGEEPNPHTGNIALKEEYIKLLQGMIAELD